MSKPQPLKVLIIGGGVGGLFLGILLDKAGIPYHIYERATHVKPLGSVMAMQANILSAFKQLDLFDGLQKISTTLESVDLYKENLSPIGAIDLTTVRDITGYDAHVFHRPDLYNLLYSRIPPENISFNKKVVSTSQTKEGVTIKTSDGHTYEGDILVAADGAYSTVRKSLYEELNEKNELPSSDKEEPKLGYICMVGVTKPLDPEQYPKLKSSVCDFSTVVANDGPYTWMTFTLANNRIAYDIYKQVPEGQQKASVFSNSEWNPESNADMIREVYNFPITHCPDGKSKLLGDLIDQTEPELISKVFLEEKLYETWHSGRTVFIGDTIHKMLPTGGQGAVNAMEDAVILANCLYEISGGDEPITYDKITEAFQDYREQRYEHAKFHVNNSQQMSQTLVGQRFISRLLRTIVYNLPRWVMSRNFTKQAVYRPQVMFLPTIPVPPQYIAALPQKPSMRYQKEQAKEV
ncbi:hypothetical protein BGZ76_008181 [Entomortierella beljakovae]|nr:hypothetical protein BGZ76_008181 [Entomortierella beljakovae]